MSEYKYSENRRQKILSESMTRIDNEREDVNAVEIQNTQHVFNGQYLNRLRKAFSFLHTYF